MIEKEQAPASGGGGTPEMGAPGQRPLKPAALSLGMRVAREFRLPVPGLHPQRLV